MTTRDGRAVVPATRLRSRLWRASVSASLMALTVTATATVARADNMMAKFIRIEAEPVTDEKTGTPVIPMLVELGTPVPINTFTTGCSVGGTGAKVNVAMLQCISNKIQKEGYQKQFEFPKDNARIVNIVGDSPAPMEVIDAVPFKDAQAANAGVAWLILMDASSTAGTRWGSMQETAEAIVKAMGEHDAVMIRIMDDKATRESTKWLGASGKQAAITKIRSVTTTYKSGGIDSLINRIEKETVGSFQELVSKGVDGTEGDVLPMVQTLVILSDGGDTSAAGFGGGAEAKVIHEKLAKGDLGIVEGVRLPIPIVSVWFPQNKWGGIGGIEDQYRNNEYQWMSNIATTEVGGYFDIIQDGETGKGNVVAKRVRSRFDNMYYVEAKAACLNTTGEQNFKLFFEDTKSKILPDSWSKVAVGFNAAKWLLAVDKKKTEDAANKKPLQPGETFEVFGEFCWGDATGRAEAYFLTEADANDVKKATADKTGKAAKALLQNLSAKGQKAETVQVNAVSAKFKVPNTPSLFENKPDSFQLNVIILDNKALRVSARDQKGLLNLRGAKAPINKLLIVGAIGGGVVLILLIAILARSGGGGRAKRRKGGAPPTPGPMPGQPPGPPAPLFAAAGPAAQPYVPILPARPMSQPPPPMPPMAPPPQIGAPVATAYAPPGTAMAPAVGPAATAYAPPQPILAPQPMQAMQPIAPSAGSYEANVAAMTFTPQGMAPPQVAPMGPAPILPPQQGGTAPQGAPPLAPAAGLHAQSKGATSFPTTCPNPSCRRQVLVPPGGTAQCAFCGTLVDAAGSAVAPIPAAGGYGLTGAVSEEAAARVVAALGPPTAGPKGGTVALQAQAGPQLHAVSLSGPSGTFRVLAGIESRAGRDGTLCSITMNEPRVSGVHATLKVEGGTLLVRDDKSHNGTYVNGNRIPPGTWTPVPGGSQLRFGPIEFTVRHE